MTFDKTKAMRNAEKYLSQGKIRSAIGEYEQVVKFDSKDFGTINMLGDLYSKNTDVQAAIRCYTAVADHYGKQGFAQKAIAVYNKISRLDPDSVEVWQKLAELYKQKGSLTEARAHFQMVADHYEKCGRKVQALGIWKEIALLDPSNTHAYLSLADGYLGENLSEEALEAYFEAGRRLSEKGEWVNAVAAYEKALSIRKDDARVLEGIARALGELGRAKEAADRLSGLLKEFPHNREVRCLLIDSLLSAGEIAEAERAVIRLVELEPANYPKFLELAEIYLDQENLPAAARILTMSSEHMLVGGQAEAFIRLVRSVLEKDPDQLDALRLQARYCSWQRDENALKESLAKFADVARSNGSLEDERYALLQLTMLIPQEVTYADRLRDVNETLGYDTAEQEENLFDKRFFKSATNGTIAKNGSLPGPEETPDEAGFAFAAEVEVVDENESKTQEPAPSASQPVAATESEPALRKEIESIRFYIDNGYLELAEKAVFELNEQFRNLPEIEALLRELASITKHAAGPVSSEDVGDAPETSAAGFVSGSFDLAELRNELGIEDAPAGSEDYETHFNTATAYKEMGLIQDAIKEFQEAASVTRANDGTRRFFACATMLGHCFMEQQMPHLAVKWFERTLDTPDLSQQERQGLWYELAVAYEQAGDSGKAGQLFEQVYAEDVDFRDVSEKIKALAVNR